MKNINMLSWYYSLGLAKRSTTEAHAVSSEDDLKEYFLFPIELLPMTSAGSLFSDSTVCTNAAL